MSDCQIQSFAVVISLVSKLLSFVMVVREMVGRTCGAEVLLGAVEAPQVVVDGDGVVAQRQVRRLVVVVIGAGERHRCEEVEAELAVRLRVLDLFALGRRPQHVVVSLVAACKDGRD